MPNIEGPVFLDSACPKCGRHCGNGGYGMTLRCQCGWTGGLDPCDVRALDGFIRRRQEREASAAQEPQGGAKDALAREPYQRHRSTVEAASKADAPIYRRFIPIGTEEQMDKFQTLSEEKNLSRDDLALILQAIKLNPDISW